MSLTAIKVIGKLFLGGIGSIGKEIRLAQQQKLEAANEEERIAADERMATAQHRRDVLVAEAKEGWNILFRMFLAMPFGIFWWKVLVWDKALGLGTTSNLSPDQYQVMMVVYSFYFVYEGARLFKRA